jgi:predicted RecA/RadA family phage recombinase
MATFIHDGNCIDYTPTAAAAAWAVIVLGDLIGVAHTPSPLKPPAVGPVAQIVT